MDKSYWIIGSKPVAKILGMETAIVIGELCSLSNYFGNKEFFFPIEKIVSNTCLTRYSVLQALKKLKDFKILLVSKRGIPAKNYYTICSEELVKVIEAGMIKIKAEESECSEESQGDSALETTEEDVEMEQQEVQNPTQSCPSTDCKLSEFDTTVSPISTPLLEKEEEKEEREGIPNNSSAGKPAETAKTKSAKPKKLPLLEREPENKYEEVEKIYLLNYKSLYEKGIMKTKEPLIKWDQVRGLEKKLFEQIDLELIKSAVSKSVNDSWCVNGGYSLSTILSVNVINRLINENEHQGNRQTKQLPAMQKQDHENIDIRF